jgi:hypothetical protein
MIYWTKEGKEHVLSQAVSGIECVSRTTTKGSITS